MKLTNFKISNNQFDVKFIDDSNKLEIQKFMLGQYHLLMKVHI